MKPLTFAIKTIQISSPLSDHFPAPSSPLRYMPWDFKVTTIQHRGSGYPAAPQLQVQAKTQPPGPTSSAAESTARYVNAPRVPPSTG